MSTENFVLSMHRKVHQRCMKRLSCASGEKVCGVFSLAAAATKERPETYGKHTGVTDLCAATIAESPGISPCRFFLSFFFWIRHDTLTGI